MARTFSSLLELGEETLRSGDLLLYPGFKYLVGQSCLLNELGDSNDTILIHFGIEDKYKWCGDIYGYYRLKHLRRGPGQFPSTEEGDYLALTRVAKAIFILFENRN